MVYKSTIFHVYADSVVESQLTFLPRINNNENNKLIYYAL